MFEENIRWAQYILYQQNIFLFVFKHALPPYLPLFVSVALRWHDSHFISERTDDTSYRIIINAS